MAYSCRVQSAGGTVFAWDGLASHLAEFNGGDLLSSPSTSLSSTWIASWTQCLLSHVPKVRPRTSPNWMKSEIAHVSSKWVHSSGLYNYAQWISFATCHSHIECWDVKIVIDRPKKSRTRPVNILASRSIPINFGHQQPARIPTWACIE